MAEVDYLYSFGSQVIPVEVKRGKSSSAKSLEVFLSEKTKEGKRPMGVHFSTKPPRWDSRRGVLVIPFYLVQQLPRLLEELRAKS